MSNGSKYIQRLSNLNLGQNWLGKDWKFDLDTGFITGNIYEARENIQQYDTWGQAHESFHWLQHIGTTSGVFLYLSQITSRVNTLDLSKHIPKNIWEKILNDRLNYNKPIIPISRNDYFLEWEKNRNLDLDIFMQSVYDLWWTRNIFYSVQSKYKLYKNSKEILSLALRDMTYVWQKLTLNNDVIDNDIKFFPVDREPITSVTYSNQILTTHILMESLALINEHFLSWSISSQNTPQNQSAYTEFLFRKNIAIDFNHIYLLPIKYFFNIKNLSELKSTLLSRELLLIFSNACDAALNPPLPPFVIHPVDGIWKIDDIFPVRRFIKIKNSLDAKKMLKLVSVDNINLLQSDLCKDAKIEPPPFDYSFCLSEHLSKYDISTNHDNFYFLCANQAWEERKKGFFHIYASGLSKDLSYNINNVSLENMEFRLLRSGIFKKFWSASPVYIDKNKNLLNGDNVSLKFSENILKSTAHTYLIDDILFRPSNLTFSNWPKEVAKDNDLKSSIQSYIDTIFSTNNWCNIN